MKTGKYLGMLLMLCLLLCCVGSASAAVWDLSTCAPNGTGEIELTVTEGDVVTGTTSYGVNVNTGNVKTLTLRNANVIDGNLSVTGNQNLELNLEGDSSFFLSVFDLPVVTISGSGTIITEISAETLILNSGHIKTHLKTSEYDAVVPDDNPGYIDVTKLVVNGGRLTVPVSPGTGIGFPHEFIMNGGIVNISSKLCGLYADNIRINGGQLFINTGYTDNGGWYFSRGEGIYVRETYEVTGGIVKVNIMRGNPPGTTIPLPEYGGNVPEGKRFRAWKIQEDMYFHSGGQPGHFETQSGAIRPVDEALAGEIYTFPDFVPINDLHVRSKFDIVPIFEDAPELPQTGDDSLLELWLALMALSAAGIYILLIKRKYA